MHGSDVFIGLSVPGVLRPADVKAMARDPIVFAMANPVPEIMPEEVRVARSRDGDWAIRLPQPDQQRALFPGVLPRTARLPRVEVTDEMKIAAAQAIASVVTRKGSTRSTSSPACSTRRSPWRSREVVHAAQRGGIARRAAGCATERRVPRLRRARQADRGDHAVPRGRGVRARAGARAPGTMWCTSSSGNPTSRRPRWSGRRRCGPSGRAGRSTRTASASCRSGRRSRSTTWRPTESRCRRTRCS